MTVQKAIKILDDFMEYKVKCRDGFGELAQKCYTSPGGNHGPATYHGLKIDPLL